MKSPSNITLLPISPTNVTAKEYIIHQCLKIAKTANFPTDYNDMREHLFGNDDNKIIFAINQQTLTIEGFAVYQILPSCQTLYLHGIVLHPKIQGLHVSTAMHILAISTCKMKYFSARTHNPRCFESVAGIHNLGFYPNGKSEEIPETIYETVRKNPHTSEADDFLIVRNAYPDEKIQQACQNDATKKIFSYLNPYDAQVVIIQIA